MSEILVEEDYCTVCEGKCTNADPDDYEHLYADLDRLIGTWLDKGTDPNAAWAFMASVLLSIAAENGMGWTDVEQTLKEAWDKGKASQGDDNGLP